MVLYKNKSFITNSHYPNTDWIGNADWVIDDSSELCDKIFEYYPKYTIITGTDENGKEFVADIIQDTSYTDAEIQDILSSKISEIKKSCESAIVSGTNADVLGRGELHYSLTSTKQDDIKVLMSNIQNGATSVLWHDDSRVMHEVYTAEQFTLLYNIVYTHIITCKITSDGLEQYATDLASTQEVDKLKAITWETTLPDYIQIQVDEQIALLIGGM